jgi:hypothetical protein
MISTRIGAIENQGELRVTARLTRLIQNEILLRHIGHIGGLIILGQEVIVGLVLGWPNLFGNREPPFVRIIERGINIKDDSAKWMNPVTYDFPDSKASLSHILQFPLLSSNSSLSLALSGKSSRGKSSRSGWFAHGEHIHGRPCEIQHPVRRLLQTGAGRDRGGLEENKSEAAKSDKCATMRPCPVLLRRSP